MMVFVTDENSVNGGNNDDDSDLDHPQQERAV